MFQADGARKNIVCLGVRVCERLDGDLENSSDDAALMRTSDFGLRLLPSCDAGPRQSSS